MHNLNLQIIPTGLLERYKNDFNPSLEQQFEQLRDSELSIETFSFYTKAWFVQSERNYYEQHHTYYSNIRKLGLEYDYLNYAEALPFLQMLPDAIYLSDHL